MDVTGGRVAGLGPAVADALQHGRAVLAVEGGTLALGVLGDHVLVGPMTPADGGDPLDDPRPGEGCVACARAWWADVAGDDRDRVVGVADGTTPAGGAAAAGGLPTARGATGAGAGPAPVAPAPGEPRGAARAPRPPEVEWDGVVREMVARVVADPPGRWRRSLLVLDRRTGTLGAHRFLVHPQCPACAPGWRAPGRLDLLGRGDVRRGPARPVARATDRVALREALVDVRLGPVVRVHLDEGAPLASATADVVVPCRGRVERGRGRSTSAAAAEVAAVHDGLRRVLGGYRRPTVPVTLARWTEVADRALDPGTLGGRASGPRAPGAPSVAFDPHRSTSWVWGRSTREDRPLLVPEHVAYARERGIGARFVAPSVTGGAVAPTREEAVLRGLLEVAEHDALMLAWASRARLVEIRPDDGGAPAAIRDLLADRGLRLRVLDVTTDLGVPVALAVVTAADDLVRAGRAPALAVASSAAVDPGDAVLAAVESCAADVLRYPGPPGPASVERYRAMLRDGDLVRTAEDRAGLHALPEARPLSAFLHDPSTVVAQADLAARWAEGGAPARPGAEGTRTTLRVLLDRVHALGTDVVVVDQSSPEVVEAVGLHAVTVVVPGTVPMTAAHRDRGTAGLPRLARGAAPIRGALPADPPPRGLPDDPPHPFT